MFPTFEDSPTRGWNLTVTNQDLLQGCGFSNCRMAPPQPSSVPCEYKAGVGHPDEKGGGDIPCFDMSDCCSLCRQPEP